MPLRRFLTKRSSHFLISPFGACELSEASWSVGDFAYGAPTWPPCPVPWCVLASIQSSRRLDFRPSMSHMSPREYLSDQPLNTYVGTLILFIRAMTERSL